VSEVTLDDFVDVCRTLQVFAGVCGCCCISDSNATILDTCYIIMYIGLRWQLKFF
jgi:hypothetical protein